jgi:hypothetical protein
MIMQEAAEPDELPPAGLALPGAVWDGGRGGEDAADEEVAGRGALEERPSEAQSSNASGSEAGLVSDYSKVRSGRRPGWPPGSGPWGMQRLQRSCAPMGVWGRGG